MYIIDRRKMERCTIPGAWIVFDQVGSTSRSGSVKDLSTSAICFRSDQKLKQGFSLNMTRSVSGEKDINIKGEVIRISERENANTFDVVVQFFLFGTYERYNSMNAYNQLKIL